jgi:hypothetical protein
VAVGVKVAVAVGVKVAVALGVKVAVAVGVKVALAVGVKVAVAVAVGVKVAVAVAVAVAPTVAVGVAPPVIVILPSTAFAGAVLRSASIKKKLSGTGAQSKGLTAPDVLPTRSILSSKRVPLPDNPAKSLAKAEMRKVRIAPEPGRTLAATFQFPLVTPAFWTGGLEKLTMVESKVKSPWKPT